MTWNVYRYNINARKIEVFNIFDHQSFKDNVKKFRKTCATKDEFASKVRSDLMYFFWCRSEYEILIAGLFARDDEHAEKVDIYKQVMLNWKQFIDYVWEATA